MDDIKRAILLFSRILDYPTTLLQEDVEHCLQILNEYDTPSAHYMKKFSKNIQGISFSHLEELYTQHIDFNPSCSLYIGYHLFGDSYKRSKFLVRLRELYRKSSFVEKGSELPDALPVILHYLGEYSYGSEDSRLIINEGILPGLKKLLKAFKVTKNIYSDVVQALLNLFVKIDQECAVALAGGGSIDD